MKYKFPFGTGFPACSTKSEFSCGKFLVGFWEQAFRPVPQRVNFFVGRDHKQAFRPVPQRVSFFVGGFLWGGLLARPLP